MLTAFVLASALICGCGGSSSGGTGTNPPPATQAAAPTISTAAAQNGAEIATLATTTSGATIYYTLDGATPTNTSQVYQAPFLIASNMTVKAIAAEPPGYLNSNVTSQSFTPNIASGTLVWSDEFSNSGTSNALPNSKVWAYDTGYQCCGNNEQETYCAAGSGTATCDPNNPNAYIDTTGILHIAARHPSGTTYTSARLKTQGQVSFIYGRVEARMMLPESQGMWPAFWLLGNNIVTINWPACGEIDVMEHINGSNPQNEGFDWVSGTIHGTGIESGVQYHPAGFSATDWHTYGMIWSKGQIQFYVDAPANVYATFTPATQSGTWPFDAGPQFILLNLAVGGDWPGAPDASAPFPSEVQVDYVRIYSN